jgi:membrane protease YdiL (CAAX protease family)
LEIWINTLFILFALGAITLLANYSDQEPRLRPVMLLTVLAFNAMLLAFPLLVIAGDSLQSADQEAESTPQVADSQSEGQADDDDDLTRLGMAASLVIAGLGSGWLTLMLWQPFRQWMSRFFPAQAPADTSPLVDNPEIIESLSLTFPLSPMIGQDEPLNMPVPVFSTANPSPAPSRPLTLMGGFRPQSMVHLWAFALTLYFVCTQLMSFALAGGLSGVAEDIEVSYGLLLANFLPQVLIPILGVGLFLRRDWRTSLQRLGLGRPTLLGVVVSVMTAGGLVFTVMVISAIWVAIVGQETFEEQTQASEALARSINTLGLAFMVAFTAGVGEELAFRGGLQPIFGFWFTTLAFVVAHTQYTLTPATLIILIVAMAFGLIRKYLDTTHAILTHFLYNFTLLVLSLIGQQVVNGEAWVAFLYLFH